MRIPKSTIVMTLVTAVPFGLAIRDTLRHKDPLSYINAMDDRYDAERDPELEAQLAKDEAERAASEAAHKAAVATARGALFGPSAGSMGRMFADVKLGDPTASAMQMYGTLRTDGANIGVDFEYVGGKLNAVAVKLLEECDDFGDALDAAWGGGSVWMNADSSVRASLDRSACTLRFERFADAESWLKAMPLAMFGKNADAFRAQLGDRVTDADESGFGWRDIGVGTGTGETTYEAVVQRGKLVGLTASAQIDVQTSDEILLAMKKQFGEPTVDDTGTIFTWKRKSMPIQLELSGDHVLLQIGSH